MSWKQRPDLAVLRRGGPCSYLRECFQADIALPEGGRTYSPFDSMNIALLAAGQCNLNVAPTHVKQVEVAFTILRPRGISAEIDKNTLGD
jgi:hypothetical protein